MAEQTEPDEQQKRLIGVEAVLGYHSVWKEQGTRNLKAGVFLPTIGTWELAKIVDAHYQQLIDEAFARGQQAGRDEPAY